MNTGQMMIGIVALSLVTITILNFNRSSISTQDSLIYNKEFVLATTVAQSMLDEVGGKFYDERIANGLSVTTESDFSTTLTAESETYPNFDDIDDYNGFTKNDTIPYMGVFEISVSVEYMTDNLASTLAKTYNKNVTVSVTSPTLVNFYTDEQDTVVISSLFSQWTML